MENLVENVVLEGCFDSQIFKMKPYFEKKVATITNLESNFAKSKNVRMAERSKAPDSRAILFRSLRAEHSGPRMWAWVRIPLLTITFLILNAEVINSLFIQCDVC